MLLSCLVVTAQERSRTLTLEEEVEAKYSFVSVSTNLLYDAVLVPNVGLEFNIWDNWTLSLNGMWAWWTAEKVSWFWRVYGGEVAVRKYFGRRAAVRSMTGHHAGLYGQALTYDFCLGERGTIGGQPGGTLFDRANFAAGLEYGYSVPVAKRLNFDFTVGLGYHWGEYHEYIPVDDCYVWQATKNRRWIGPTKAEISLVWLIGKGNYNKGKGGER